MSTVDDIVNIPIEDGDAVAFGNVRTLVYRDLVNGVRYTAHADWMTGAYWIVRHGPTDRNDSDGPAVMRSALLYGDGSLNAAWARVRAAETRGSE